jgi:hypothetical protein
MSQDKRQERLAFAHEILMPEHLVGVRWGAIMVESDLE